MKPETRSLYVFVKKGIFVGIIKRKDSIEHILIKKSDENLWEELLKEDTIKQVRRVFMIEGTDMREEIEKIFSPQHIRGDDLIEFIISIINEIEKLAGRDNC